MEKCTKCNSGSIVIDKKGYKHWHIYRCLNCSYWIYKERSTCCDEKYEIITIDHKESGHIALYYQCLNCGNSPNRSKPLSTKKYGDRIEREFSKSRFFEYKESKNSEKETLSHLKYEHWKRNTKRYKYYLYLISDEWKVIRERVKERDNFTCQICKIKKVDEVHHLNYENVFNEKLSDLISVCSVCHKELHKNDFKE